MSRHTPPKSFLEKVILFEKVLAKHTADDASSVLIPFFTQEEIVIADDTTAVADAQTAHTSASVLEKSSELNRAERDRLFDPVFKRHQNCVQFLKSLYRSNVHQLGDWSVVVDGENRINYPENFMERAVQVLAFLAKHDSYIIPGSPLQPYVDQNGIDSAQDSSDTSDAIIKHNAFIAESEEKENQIEQRDNLIDPVNDHLLGIAQYLMNLYSENPQNAGQWGFVIDHSPQANHTRTFTVDGGATKIVKNVVVGTKMKNIGVVQLLIRPQDDVTAEPIYLNPTQEFTVARGFGQMNVSNNAGNPDGAFEATINT